MTYSMIVGKYKLIFSDTHFKDFRKKPTISVYDADTNSETKIASFNSQETFEWFIEAVVKADRKTEPSSSEIPNSSTISKMEQVDKDINVRSKDEPQADCDGCQHYADKHTADDCYECKRSYTDGYEPQTERSE